MIILTAGHTGPNSGAQCAATHFDEGAENIWLRNRVAEILTNQYGLVVLVDDDTASLKLLTQTMQNAKCKMQNCPHHISSPLKKYNGESKNNCEFFAKAQDRWLCSVNCAFLIDIHFNAHSNPQARGTEAIVSDDATPLELRFASRLAHTTSDALNIPLRSIKSESQTPHRRLGMLHLTPQSIILEVCFCTSPEDVVAYRANREKLAEELAHNIAELVK